MRRQRCAIAVDEKRTTEAHVRLVAPLCRFQSFTAGGGTGLDLAGLGRAWQRPQRRDQIPIAQTCFRNLAAGAPAVESGAKQSALSVRHRKLGAQWEGLLRNHRRLADVRLDSTALYRIDTSSAGHRPRASTCGNVGPFQKRCLSVHPPVFNLFYAPATTAVRSSSSFAVHT